MCVALTQKGVNFGSRFNIGSSRRRNFCQGLFINSEEAWHSFHVVTRLKTDLPICGSTSAFNPSAQHTLVADLNYGTINRIWGPANSDLDPTCEDQKTCKINFYKPSINLPET